ncbi:MAG TPA: asparagine--tRNA ligase [Candidatus Caccovivens faecavium]|nr:asparagine--tRNA ligase [Candidatus Caccovivens faecavium]
MKRIELRDLNKNYEKFKDKTITVCGWARTIRDSKNIAFIELNDGAFKSVQIVVERAKIENYDVIVKENVGSSFEIKGRVILTPEAKQPFEINADEVEILGSCDLDYPLQKKRHTVEFLRTIPTIRPRGNLFNAVFRIRSVSAFAIHKFFNERNFVYVHTPIITANDCEGAGEMFQVTTLDLEKLPKKDGKVDYSQDFFGKKVSLTVSGQLHEETMTHAFGKTYTFGPTFRAENSNTSRHAAEFWMMEPEICFCDLDELMDNEEEMVKYVISYVMQECEDELEFLNKFVDNGLIERLKNVVENEFVRLDYTEAIKILEKVKERFVFPVKWGVDLQSEHERYLTEEVYKKPVFLKNYPKDIKAFYMRQNDDGKTVAAVDMLVPGIGELCGGSQREERLEKLRARLKELGLKEEDYAWYLDTRRYGTNVHSGYGLGFERLVMYLTGISNIRDVEFFPRTVGSIQG